MRSVRASFQPWAERAAYQEMLRRQRVHLSQSVELQSTVTFGSKGSLNADFSLFDDLRPLGGLFVHPVSKCLRA